MHLLCTIGTSANTRTAPSVVVSGRYCRCCLRICMLHGKPPALSAILGVQLGTLWLYPVVLHTRSNT